jgi:hypothetical protein
VSICRSSISYAGCNNGWLSDLEGSVRLVISAIILDLPVVLGHIQTQVSAWCFKPALIAQKAGRDGIYTDADARAFRAMRLPPATHTAIWLAHHTGEVSVSSRPSPSTAQSRRASQPSRSAT